MKLIAFTGLKQSGKDTAVNLLRALVLPAKSAHINFADALKAEVAKACGVAVSQINSDKDTFRTILQWWGSDFRRKLYGDNYWILKWLQAVNRVEGAKYLFCSDVRFLNEAQIIKDCGGTVVRIVRPGQVCDGHISETEQAKIAVDFEVINDGNINDLTPKLKHLIK